MSGMTCPACQTGKVMRQRMVHDAGTSTTTTTTTGVGGVVDGGGVAPGVFAASSSGQQQSTLAKKCAPPEKGPTFGLVVLSLIVLFIAFWLAGSDIGPFKWGTFGIGAAIAAFVFAAAVNCFVENRTKHPVLLAAYERKWICMACGHAWERDPPLPGTPPPR